MKLAARTFNRDDYYLTSAFGKRTEIKTKAGITSTTHQGTDYGTHGNGWPQYALEDGTVVTAGRDKDGANYVKIKYPRLNITLLYYHLHHVYVKSGQAVNHSTCIGTTGMTGKATGVHLHLQLWKGTRLSNPELYDYQPPEGSAEWLTYTVKKGDTLSYIGTLYGCSWKDIQAWNNIKNPNLIKIGQKLKIKVR